jgi:thioredoxin 1
LSETVRVVTDSDWDHEVLQAAGPVLVDFWAEWCPPCRKLTPVIEALAVEYDGRLKVVKLNIDDSPEVTTRYGIVSIPTLLLFRGGRVLEQSVGFRPIDELRRLVDAHQGEGAAAAS